MRLFYSTAAIADLIRLRDFIAAKDPSAAARIAEQLVQRVEKLRGFPALGRPVPDAPDPLTVRDAIFGNFVVRYSVLSDALIVLRIWHNHEDRGREP